MDQAYPLSDPCPCKSGTSYKECCQRLHKGIVADNALELMRSRYSAYALGLADYIIATTHPASTHYTDNLLAWRRDIGIFCQNTLFQNLEILDFHDGEHAATVTFVAHLLQKGQTATFTEKSYFEKWKGCWLYHSGITAPGRVCDLKDCSH